LQDETKPKAEKLHDEGRAIHITFRRCPISFCFYGPCGVALSYTHISLSGVAASGVSSCRSYSFNALQPFRKTIACGSMVFLGDDSVFPQLRFSLTLSAIEDFSLTLVPLKPNRRLHALFFIVVGNWVVCGRGLSYCFFIQVLDIFSQKKLTISKLFDAAMMFASGLAFILRANVFV